jgi:transmembrane sensor
MKDVFIKYFKGELTSQEEKDLLDWIDESEANHQEFFRERKLWDMILLNVSDESSAKTGSDENRDNHFHPVRKRWLYEIGKIAAVFILAFGAGTWFSSRQTTMPPAEHMNTIEVPAGQRVHLVLSDGTKVWLNARTHFSFPDHFNMHNRTVQLDGEAMFDVAHNEKAPFLVNTSNYQVKVLGTQFNVFAYKNGNVFETTLIRGKVILTSNNDNTHSIELKPDQQLKYNIRDHKEELREVDAQARTTWVDGILSFNDQSFSSIAQRLERYYNVDIEVNYPELLDFRFTGKFRYSDSLPVILDVVKKYKSFRYIENGNKITVYK